MGIAQNSCMISNVEIPTFSYIKALDSHGKLLKEMECSHVKAFLGGSGVIHCTMYVVVIDRKPLSFFSLSWPHAGQFIWGVDKGIFFFFCLGPSNGKRLGVVLTNVAVTALMQKQNSNPH